MTYNLQTNMLYDFYMRIEISLRANNQLELKSMCIKRAILSLSYHSHHIIVNCVIML